MVERLRKKRKDNSILPDLHLSVPAPHPLLVRQRETKTKRER